MAHPVNPKPLRFTPCTLALALSLAGLQGCHSSDTTETVSDSDTASETSTEFTATDITNAVFSNRSSDCADYTNTYVALVLDIQESREFEADVLITSDSDSCTFTSNSIPNHDFNDETANFAEGTAQTEEVDLAFTVTRSPSFASTVTPLSQSVKNGVFLNGVKLDILSAGCYRPSSALAGEDGNTAIGCLDGSAWLLDPLSTELKFGADQHNAHIQPGGQYHYHGNPKAMFDDFPGSEGSPVIGFAADGFPIYGSYFYDETSGSVRKATSSYQLKAGNRVALYDPYVGEELNPSDNALNSAGYDGSYVDDWEYVAGSGDLDECNGMTVNGQYGYYAIDSYPWVIKCFKGTPHESFGTAGGEGPDEMAGPGGMLPPPGLEGMPPL